MSKFRQEGYLVGSDNGGCRLRATHGAGTLSLSICNDTAYGSVRFIVDTFVEPLRKALRRTIRRLRPWNLRLD